MYLKRLALNCGNVPAALLIDVNVYDFRSKLQVFDMKSRSYYKTLESNVH